LEHGKQKQLLHPVPDALTVDRLDGRHFDYGSMDGDMMALSRKSYDRSKI
jgi:hypothetical protein